MEMTREQKVDEFIRLYIDGAQGCEMDYASAQFIAQQLQQQAAALADVTKERDAWVKRGMLAEKLVDEQQATIAKLEKDWEELNDTADEQLATIQRLEGERDSAQDLKKFYKAEIDRADKLMNDFGIPNIAIECGDMLKPVDERIELVFVQRDTLKQRLATVEAALTKLRFLAVNYQKSDHPAGAYQCDYCKQYGAEAATVRHMDSCPYQALAPAPGGQPKETT